jgi:hypothetical protein
MNREQCGVHSFTQPRQSEWKSLQLQYEADGRTDAVGSVIKQVHRNEGMLYST